MSHAHLGRCGRGRDRSEARKPSGIAPLEPRILFAAGDPDFSFSNDGIAITDFFGQDNFVGDVAVQRDGKVVVVGEVAIGDAMLMRYRANGTLDSSFNQDGRARTNFSGGRGFDSLSSVIVLANGRILVGGTIESRRGGGVTDTDFLVARYTAQGVLDTTFGGGDGWATVDFGRNQDDATGIAVHNNGAIVVVGFSGDGSETSFAVARFRADGTPDNAFSGDGKLTESFSAENSAFANAVAIQGDGRIVVVGAALVAGQNRIAIARYNANGTLDADFDTDGKVLMSYVPSGGSILSSSANCVAVQADGKIVFAGGLISDSTSRPSSMAVVRLTTDGQLDPRFGIAGQRFIGWSGDGNFNDRAMDLVIQRSGHILLAGPKSDDGISGGMTYFIMRYNSRGVAADMGNGSALVPIDLSTTDTEDAMPMAIALAPNGRIVIAGHTLSGGNGWNVGVYAIEGDNPAQYASIAGVVFRDADGDGFQDPPEGGLSGIPVYLDANNNGIREATEQYALTGLGGVYKLDGLVGNPYDVRIDRTGVPAFTQTLPGANAAYGINLAGGEVITDFDFGLKPPTTPRNTTHITGSVFNDENGNRTREFFEGNVYGGQWRVFLDADGDNRLDAGEVFSRIDRWGNYLFNNLAPGTYRVALHLPAGWGPSQPRFGAYAVTVTAGGAFVRHFGVQQAQ